MFTNSSAKCQFNAQNENPEVEELGWESGGTELKEVKEGLDAGHA